MGGDKAKLTHLQPRLAVEEVATLHRRELMLLLAVGQSRPAALAA